MRDYLCILLLLGKPSTDSLQLKGVTQGTTEADHFFLFAVLAADAQYFYPKPEPPFVLPPQEPTVVGEFFFWSSF